MKIKNPLTLSLLTLSVAAAALSVKAWAKADPATTPADQSAAQPSPVAPTPGFTDAQLIEEVGWLMAKKSGLTELGFTPAEGDSLLKGFAAAIGGKESPYDIQKVSPELDAFMQKKQSVYMAKLKQQNSAQASDFFTKLKDNKNVIQLPSGLCYEIVKPGDGPYPVATDTVKVNYTGTLVDGTVFDSSVQRGQPVEFPLDGVIAGWTEGIQKINKGGKIKLYIPADLAYGNDGRPGIPPGATLIFDVELLDIKATAPAPATPAAPAAPPDSAPKG
jgi:FKBP-type peptidyl-prolyl cis-trans isomerase